MPQCPFTPKPADRPLIAVRAGKALVEPANVSMTGYNRSASDPLQLAVC